MEARPADLGITDDDSDPRWDNAGGRSIVDYSSDFKEHLEEFARARLEVHAVCAVVEKMGGGGEAVEGQE